MCVCARARACVRACVCKRAYVSVRRVWSCVWKYAHRLDNAMNAQSCVGVKDGLQLLLNIEQYQYTKGPHNAAGLKLLLHGQDEIPQVENFGDAIPAGMHVFVAVDVSKVSDIE